MSNQPMKIPSFKLTFYISFLLIFFLGSLTVMAENPNTAEQIVKIYPPPSYVSGGVKLKAQKIFLDLLKERFTEEELVTIKTTLDKIDIIDLDKAMAGISREILTLSTYLETCTVPPDVELKISPTYEKILEEQLDVASNRSQLKEEYLKKCGSSSKELKDAEDYARVIVKYQKKIIADNISEEKYRLKKNFYDSSLGQKFNNIYAESLRKAVESQR